MTKTTDLPAADTGRADISWRHFWLANVIVETDRPPTVRALRPQLRRGKESLTKRLERLHHMRATLGGPRQ